jgi:hypothetical protein
VPYIGVMRPLLLALLPAVLSAAPALEIVRPFVSQMDGGAPDPAGFEHVAGETLWIQCRVAGYAKTDKQEVHLKYSVQPFDPKGVALDEVYSNELKAELSVQDKEWLPKIATSIQIPPLAGPGTYKVLVKVEDVVAKANAELPISFKVRAREVEPSDTLIVRNFRFYRDEDANQPAEKGVFKPGDGVFARFDIIGYQFGPKNKVDVQYVTTVIAPGGKVLWTQPEPAVERSEAFYPQRYVPAAMGISLQKTIKPGEYAIGVQVKDAIGGQTYESKFTFTIE